MHPDMELNVIAMNGTLKRQINMQVTAVHKSITEVSLWSINQTGGNELPWQYSGVTVMQSLYKDVFKAVILFII